MGNVFLEFEVGALNASSAATELGCVHYPMSIGNGDARMSRPLPGGLLPVVLSSVGVVLMLSLFLCSSLLGTGLSPIEADFLGFVTSVQC